MKIFSIETKRSKGKFSKRVLSFFGIKISWSKPQIQDVLDALDIDNLQTLKVNSNLIYFVFKELKNAKNDELYYLGNSIVCFIFNKNIIKFGYNNFVEFILNNVGTYSKFLEFKQLSKENLLYKEHILRVNDNEFLWKYIDRNNIIRHSYILYENQKFYMCEKILDKSFAEMSKDNYYFSVKNTKRVFILGVTIKQYLQNKSFEEKKETLIRLIDYIYNKFSVADDKIDGIVYDCNLCNFIIDDDLKFYFIDDDFVSKEPVDRKHVVTYVLRDIDDYYLCKEVFEHFGHFNLPELETKTKCELKSKYSELKNKYFT